MRNQSIIAHFEGGGGKGVVYLGVIQALEGKMGKYAVSAINLTKADSISATAFKYDYSPPPGGIHPLFPIWSSMPEHRKLKGVSGSSAGAITAFFLAMGLNSTELQTEMNAFTRGYLAGHEMIVMSEFESFFSDPEPFKWRRYHPESNVRFKKGISPLDDFIKSKLQSGQEYFAGLLPFWPTFFAPAEYLAIRTLFQQFARNWGPNIIAGAVETKLDRFCSRAFYNDFLIKKLLLTDAVWNYESAPRPKFTNTEFWGEPKEKRVPTDSLPLCFRFPSHANLKAYIHSLVVDRGLFSGIAVRNYFAKKLKKYIIDQAQLKRNGDLLNTVDPHKFNFKDFFNLTGVDLVVTGVNAIQGIPVSFSVSATPDFPVIDAVGASMSIPFLFKPFAIEDRVNKSMHENAYENLMYYGLIVDGGMLNNYPVHAFNEVKTAMVRYGNVETPMQVRFPSSHHNFKPRTAGFRLQANLKSAGLQSELDPREIYLSYKSRAAILKETDPEPYEVPFGSYLGSLYNSTSFPSELGQFDHSDVAKRTVLIDTGDLSLTDFSGPVVDVLRGRQELREKKELLIKKARSITLESLR
ncbi:MAG: patatin-like phospholipase family protein [Bacteroidia bacterium]